MGSDQSTPQILRTTCVLLLAVSAFFAVVGRSQDIDFKNRVATFTNLEGTLYKEVEIVRGDLDGILWRDGASGGRVCYTNLDLGLLESLGISSNRVEIARARALRKAAADAQFRALRLKEAQVEMRARQKQDAEWRKGAPARQREAQRQTDLAAIETIRRQLELAQDRADVANATTPVQAAGDPDFVGAVMARRFQVNLAQVEVNRAKKQLEVLEADYEKKYGSGTNPAPPQPQIERPRLGGISL